MCQVNCLDGFFVRKSLSKFIQNIFTNKFFLQNLFEILKTYVQFRFFCTQKHFFMSVYRLVHQKNIVRYPPFTIFDLFTVLETKQVSEKKYFLLKSIFAKVGRRKYAGSGGPSYFSCSPVRHGRSINNLPIIK